MKTFKTLFAAMIATLMASVAVVADHGSITVTNITLGPIKAYDIYWYGGATNHADTTAATISGANGEIQRVTFTAIDATNTYTVTIKDKMGVDILAGTGTAITTNASPGVFTTKNICPMVDGSAGGITNSVKMTFEGDLYVVATNTHVGASGIVSIKYIGK
jgi:hypothetical protein